MPETALDKAIRESREREEKATKGPWEYHPEEQWVDPETGPAGEPPGVSMPHPEYGRCCATFFSNEDALFAAATRTWEPRFREALAVAVKGIYHDGCDGGLHCGGCDLEAQINRILEGR